VTVRPISIRWISDVPSKIVKIADYDRGADVTLISSAGRLPVPCGVSRAAFDDVASLREVVISGDLGS
jgi:hypothetical protein